MGAVGWVIHSAFHEALGASSAGPAPATQGAVERSSNRATRVILAGVTGFTAMVVTIAVKDSTPGPCNVPGLRPWQEPLSGRSVWGAKPKEP